MHRHRTICGTVIAAIVLSMPLAIGCHGSEETMDQRISPSPAVTPDSLRQEIAQLKAERDSLKYRVQILDQFTRDATARTSDLEAQLNTLKHRLTSEPSPAPATAPSGEDPRGIYRQALDLFRSARYAEAAAAFQEALDGGIEASLQDNCYYWLGECAYGRKDYRQAIDLFDKVFTFQISEKKDDAQIMIANCYLAMGDKANAKAEYEALIKKFPASPFVGKAKAKLQKL